MISPAQGFEDLGEGRYAVRGPLRFQNVPTVWREAVGRFATPREVVVDLSGVTEVDSAGLALLVEWLRDARKAGGAVRFANAPAKLLAIARVTRLDVLLG